MTSTIVKDARAFDKGEIETTINHLYQLVNESSGKPIMEKQIPKLVKLLVQFMRKYKHTKYDSIEQLREDIEAVLNEYQFDIFEEELDKVVEGVVSELPLKRLMKQLEKEEPNQPIIRQQAKQSQYYK